MANRCFYVGMVFYMVLVSGCSAGTECDTTGTFLIDMNWATDAGPLGVCGFADPDAQTITVVRDPEAGDDRIKLIGLSGRILSGKSQGCQLQVSYQELSFDMERRLFEIEFDRLPDDRLMGSGRMQRITTAGTCDQPIVITGRVVDSPAATLGSTL